MNPETRSGGRDEQSSPVRLNRETILAAAEQILRSEGLDAMTMRRVGTELGIDPTAIYRHYRNKEELVIELADRAFGRVALPGPELSWQDALRHVARSVRQIYAVHVDFATVLVRQADDTPNLERLTEETLRILAEAGLPPAEAARMYAVVVTHIAGSGLYNATIGAQADDGDDGRASARRTYAALPPAEFPHAVAAAPYLFPDSQEADELGLELLIGAIERLGAAHRAGRAGTPDDDGDA
jgi:AcrR family transcriptional regulator